MRGILLICMSVCFALVSCTTHSLEKVSALTSSLPGSGMDGGHGGIKAFGGGSFEASLCQGFSCCSTGRLNSEDDNWEVGQVDWFVGRQIGHCSKASFRTEETLKLTLKHQGGNAGRLEWIKLYDWRTTPLWTCPLNVRLDHTNQHTVVCVPDTEVVEEAMQCNGRKEFCKLNFKDFLFPGTHNSGTGQYGGALTCAFKNQDLNIVEQLDFGILLFDLDVIYSTDLLNCHGLATGHGRYPGAGLYQCYGGMDVLLAQVRQWLEDHPSQVVVLYFGNIAWPAVTVPRLKNSLLAAFPSHGDGVKINSEFKSNGTWPTLGEAVEQNRRVFVFIRDADVGEDELEFVREIKVKPKDEDVEEHDNKTVTILTGYKAKSVGSDCGYVVESSRRACGTQADFVKLSLLSTFGYGEGGGTECLWSMAKKCNEWVDASVGACNNRGVDPNFVLVDYPNYTGIQLQSIVQFCQKENLARASRFNPLSGSLTPLESLEICSGSFVCCPEVTEGDNIAGTEKFVQESEYKSSFSGCADACQKLHPFCNGITESKTKKYGNGAPLGWCEFGEAVFHQNRDYQTCKFKIDEDDYNY